jgi:hypothetical protein
MHNGAPEDLPTELKAFLYSCIDSVEAAEILVLLCRTRRPWTTRTVAVELGMLDAAARSQLETLAARGLLHITIDTEVMYTYAPKTPELRRYGDQLTALYATSRTAILRVVATNPRRSVKRFADAFRWRDPE